MADFRGEYTAISAPTFTLASLAASSTLVAGRESAAVDNSTTRYTDCAVRLRTRTGTSPTAGVIELWCIPSIDNSTWPDVFDGTDSAETVTSRDILFNSGRLIAITATDTTTGRDYELLCPSMRDVFGILPQRWVFFVTHSTVAALDSTGGNHVLVLNGYNLTDV